MSPAQRPAGHGSGFFRARWNGEVALERLFWRDMIFIATALNACGSFLALLLLGFKMPLAVVLAAHFAIVPYNLFLTLAVWRTAERYGESTVAYMTGATLWLMLVTVI